MADKESERRRERSAQLGFGRQKRRRPIEVRRRQRAYCPRQPGAEAVRVAGKGEVGDVAQLPLECRKAARRRDRPVIYGGRRHQVSRSEVHTSELQSLMRITYAVFGL